MRGIRETLGERELGKFGGAFPGDADSREWLTLTEGGTSLLADIVWARIVARFPETGDEGRTNYENWSEIILGPHYVSADPEEVRSAPLQHRYATEAQAMRLV